MLVEEVEAAPAQSFPQFLLQSLLEAPSVEQPTTEAAPRRLASLICPLEAEEAHIPLRPALAVLPSATQAAAVVVVVEEGAVAEEEAVEEAVEEEE